MDSAENVASTAETSAELKQISEDDVVLPFSSQVLLAMIKDKQLVCLKFWRVGIIHLFGATLITFIDFEVYSKIT